MLCTAKVLLPLLLASLLHGHNQVSIVQYEFRYETTELVTTEDRESECDGWNYRDARYIEMEARTDSFLSLASYFIQH